MGLVGWFVGELLFGFRVILKSWFGCSGGSLFNGIFWVLLGLMMFSEIGLF